MVRLGRCRVVLLYYLLLLLLQTIVESQVTYLLLVVTALHSLIYTPYLDLSLHTFLSNPICVILVRAVCFTVLPDFSQGTFSRVIFVIDHFGALLHLLSPVHEFLLLRILSDRWQVDISSVDVWQFVIADFGVQLEVIVDGRASRFVGGRSLVYRCYAHVVLS